MTTTSSDQKRPEALRTDTTRLETFSDAVFAFSATLLVVSLEVPNSFPELVEDLRGFVAFGVRFGVLLCLWSVHHAFFRRFSIADGMTIALNACLLFVILFYVYPLKFMSEGIVSRMMGTPIDLGLSSEDDLALMFMLYSGGFVAVFLFVALMYWHAYKSAPKLGLSLLDQLTASFYARHYAILSIVGGFSILMAAFKVGLNIGAPGYLYMILGPLCYWHGHKHHLNLKKLDLVD